MKRWSFLGLAVLMIVVVGCTNETESYSSMAGPSKQTLASLSEDAKKVDVVLPAFVKDRPAIVQENYKLAYANQDVLKYMPCFCGCVNQGHQSNWDCFIQDVKKNGEVVWDRMSIACDICNGIARDAIAMHKEGKPLIEIRKYIDEKYGEQGQPTNTPMPPKNM